VERIFSRRPKPVNSIETKYRRIATALPVPESVPILEMIEKFEPRSVQEQPPVVWDRADGFQVYDRYGNMWLDWSSGVLVSNIGHGHPDIKNAAIKEIQRGLLFSYSFPTEVRSKLAKMLVELAPPGLDKVFFLTTGSETTENAIKLSRTYGQVIGGSGKTVIVTFQNGFHGRTLGAQLAGGSDEAKAWIGNLDPDFIQVPFPDGFRCPDTGFHVFEKSLADQGVDLARIAGVMMESYQGGGASFAPTEYVRQLRQWCEKHDALLIFDEVQAGFGRTGKLFGFEHYDVVPDMVCLGKALSGSLPLAAVLGRKDILDLYGPGSMSSTHGGHPVSCAAALANLETLITEGLVENADTVGRSLLSGLKDITDKFSKVIGILHGKGLVYGLHMVKPDSSEPDGDLAFDVVKNCFQNGLLMFAPVGLGGATIKICPPLMISREAVEDGINVLDGAVEQALRAQRKLDN